MKLWKTQSRDIILDRKPRLAVEKRHVELPDGTQNEDWLWLDAPEYAVVTAVDANGQLRIGAAVGISGDVEARAEGLLAAGADVDYTVDVKTPLVLALEKKLPYEVIAFLGSLEAG